MGSNGFLIFFSSKSELDAFLHVSSRNSYLLIKQNFLGLSNEMGIEDKDEKWQPESCAFGKTLCISEGYCVCRQDCENGHCMFMNLAEFRIMP